jgi:sulfite reductase (ferredoxin)
MPEVVKETKAQKAERLKRELNPWDALDQIRRFAREGVESIPPEWNTYFRWWGVYTQGDGVGAVGGVGGEGKAVPYFMLRIRIPNGLLYAHQLRTIADLAERHARGVADITVRQNIQLHWVSIESLPVILEELWKVNLSTVGACGDVTRNITGCPLAGIDAEEIVDASPIALAATRLLQGNNEFFNFPRKYKISVSGCRSWCNYPEINDIGMTAVRRGDEVGFALRVGGGLSTEPHLAVKLPAFIRWEQAIPTIQAVSEIFRDADVLRVSREKARLKYLFMEHDWTPGTFLAEVEKRLGYRLDAEVPEVVPEDVYRDHVGVHAQKQPGLSYVGASVLRGRITPEQMRAAADLAERFGGGDIRTTIMQNLVVGNVATAQAAAVVEALEAAGMPVQASPFQRGTIACTGTEFCKLAIAETKGFSRWLAGQLDERMPGFDEHLKIHVTGCPNSCGQHWIADIGLEGKKVKVDGKMQDAFYFFLGGAVGEHAGFSRKVGYRCPATEVPDAIQRLLTQFQQHRAHSENLREFFARHDEDELRSFLSGEPAA